MKHPDIGFISSELWTTLSVVLLTLVLRTLVGRKIRNHETLAPEMKRRWLLHLRNSLLILMFFSLFTIWGNELRGVAFSLVAFAAALVLATKELIMCVSGALLKSGGNAFRVGDRIEIDSIRGEVIDQNLLTTTVLEIGPGYLTHQRTGRRIVIPNSLFLSKPISNESFSHDFVLHVFTVPMPREDDWNQAATLLLEGAVLHTASYIEEARSRMELVGRNEALEVFDVDPRVTLQFPDEKKINLVVRLPVPCLRRGRIEQAVLRHWLEQKDVAKETKDAGTDPGPS